MDKKEDAAEKELREEVRDVLEEVPKPESRVMALIFDGKQFSVRIPREFADVLGLDKTRHRFKFTLEKPSPLDEKPKLKLVGELIEEQT